jgi:hypothetical protein
MDKVLGTWIFTYLHGDRIGMEGFIGLGFGPLSDLGGGGGKWEH